MSEPIIVYRSDNGEPYTVHGLACLADLLASGEYVTDPRTLTPPAVKEPEPVKGLKVAKERDGKKGL